MAGIKHDAVSQMLVTQIEAGIAEINKANESLLAEESGTSVREIDKVLKDAEAEVPENIKALWSKADEAYKVYRENVEAARNAYRTDVLGEEAQSDTSDVDKDALKDVRKVVMDALTFLKSYAVGNGRKDLVDWAESLSVPQVGRQGSSTVGAKKPRVFVKVGDKVYGSFSETAAALSDKDNKITAGQLAEAWNSAGGAEGEFTFGENTLEVSYKPKSSAGK